MLILGYWFVSPLLIIKSRNTISNALDKKFRDNLPNWSMVHQKNLPFFSLFEIPANCSFEFS